MNISVDTLVSSIKQKTGTLSCVINGLYLFFSSDCFSATSSKQKITITDETNTIFPILYISIDLNTINQIEFMLCHDNTLEYQITADEGETLITITIKEDC